MLPSVVKAYEQEGYRFRLGSPRFYTSGVHPIGRATFPTDVNALPLSEVGFTLTDFYFFNLIANEIHPETGLVIGNAFGISSISLAEVMKPISIDAIDAEVMGEASREGSDLTRRVAARLGLDMRVTKAYSPRDLDAACRHARYGLVFIDGLHTSEQIIADFMGVAERLADRCAVVFHDVGLCGMDEGWEHIKRIARPMSLKPFDLTFTDYGLTVLLRGAPNLEFMLARTCPALRDFNEVYEVGCWWHQPGSKQERQVHHVDDDERIAFYGAGNDLEVYRSFIEAHPDRVAAIIDDSPALRGANRFGVRIAQPVELPRLGIDAVVVSTQAHDAAVRARLSRIVPGMCVLPAPGWPFHVELHVQESPLATAAS